MSGQPIAVVVAHDPYVARDAVELITVDYEPLVPVLDPMAATRDNAPVGTNVAMRLRQRAGDLEGALAQADHVVRQRYVVQRIVPAPLETRGVLAQYQPQEDFLTVWNATQAPHRVKHFLVHLLQRPEQTVRVIAPDVGGSFGVKDGLFPEDVLIPYLAIRLRHPVKWIEEQRENMLAYHGRGHSFDIEAAVRHDGVLHYYVVFLEGVSLERTDQGLKPRFVKGEPPTDAAIADVVQTISRRVLRKLRHLGYLEAGIDAVATEYAPCVDDAPELARTLAASVQQRIAFGERAGHTVRRIGSGFGHAGELPTRPGSRCASVNGFSLHANTQVPAHRRDQLERLLRSMARGAVALARLAEDAHGDLVYTFTKPWSAGTTGITLAPLALLEKLAALVPLPRVHLVRYGGCVAPPSSLRGAVTPTLRQQGVEGQEANTGTPRWSWARRLGPVFDLDMTTCPLCRRGSLRILAALTQESVSTRLLRPRKLASVPPPMAPARSRQVTFDWVA
jgi:hypothetical protein